METAIRSTSLFDATPVLFDAIPDGKPQRTLSGIALAVAAMQATAPVQERRLGRVSPRSFLQLAQAPVAIRPVMPSSG
jgi:hypothetical protein